MSSRTRSQERSNDDLSTITAETPSSRSATSTNASLPALQPHTLQIYRQDTAHVEMLEEAQADTTTTQPYTRVTWRRSIAALLSKNWLLLWRRRSKCATALEILLPVLCVALVSLLKSASYTLLEPVIDSRNNATVVTQEASLTGVLLHLSARTARDATAVAAAQPERVAAASVCAMHVLQDNDDVSASETATSFPRACHGLAVPYRIAVVPDTLFTRQYFVGAATTWYPRILLSSPQHETLTVPSLNASVAFFPTDAALETYVQASDYGADAAHPKIYAAIVFENVPLTPAGWTPAALKVAIRMHASDDSGGVSTRPHSLVADSRQRDRNETLPLESYATHGFLTLQTLVRQFTICHPHWDATAQLTNGTCQHEAPVRATRAKETQVLEQLGQDVLINDALAVRDDMTATSPSLTVQSQRPAALMTPARTFAADAWNQSNAIERLLLRPVHQLPSPHLHNQFALVSPPATPRRSSLRFYTAWRDYVAIGLCASTIVAAMAMAETFIHERASRTRAYLRVLGVHDRAVWLAWAATYSGRLTLSAALQTLVLALCGVFPHCSALVLLLLLTLFGWSLLAGAFVVSAVVARARVGAAVSAFVVLTTLSLHERLLVNAPRGSYCVPQLVLIKALRVLMATEDDAQARTITLATLDRAVDGERLSLCFLALALHCVLYTLTGLYLERVLPRRSGDDAFERRDKWYFPLAPSFWIQQRPSLSVQSAKHTAASSGPMTLLRVSSASTVSDSAVQRTPSMDVAVLSLRKSSWLESFMTEASSRSTEDATPSSTRGAGHAYIGQAPLRADEARDALCLYRVSHAVATVGGHRKPVLQDVSLALASGTLTAIVGGPGAGKTTLMALLQMRTALTAGDICFDSVSWRTSSRASVQQRIRSVCFATDVLFQDLTVHDHLVFYAALQGVGRTTREHLDAAERQLSALELAPQRNVLVKALAVSTRRKLTLATALLRPSDDGAENDHHSASNAPTSLVLLDDPMRGMDPYARALSWRVVQQQCDRETVAVVTTRDVSDAQRWSDRIAVLAPTGRLVFAGSVADFAAWAPTAYVVTLQTSAAYHDSAVRELVRSRLKTDVRLEASDDKKTVALCIPAGSASTGSLAALFQALETQARALGVTSHRLELVRPDDALGTSRASSSISVVDCHDATAPLATEQDHEALVVASGSQDTWLARPSPSRRTGIFSQVVTVVKQRLCVTQRARGHVLLVLTLPAVALVACMAIVGSLERTFADPALRLTAQELAAESSQDHVRIAFGCIDTETHGSRQEHSASSLCRDLFASSSSSVAATAWRDTTLMVLNASTIAALNSSGQEHDSASLLEQARRLSSVADLDAVASVLVLESATANTVDAVDIVLNTSAPHASSIVRALVDAALVQVAWRNASASLNIVNHPLPLTAHARRRAIAAQQGVTVNALLVVIALAFVPATVVARLVRERQTGASYYELLTGAHAATRWLGHYSVDVAIQGGATALVLLVIWVCDVTTWTGTARDRASDVSSPFTAVTVLSALFALAATSAAYAVASVVPRQTASHATTVRVCAFVLFAGSALPIFGATGPAVSAYPVVQEALTNALSFSPFFSLCFGLHRLAFVEVAAMATTSAASEQSGDVAAAHTRLSPFDPDVTGVSVLYLAATTVLFFAVAVTLEVVRTSYADTRRRRKRSGHDADASDVDPGVAEEHARVTSQLRALRSAPLETPFEGDAVLVHRVTRDTKETGDDSSAPVSFGVARGECLVIVGAEASDKSALLQLVTGERAPRTGSVVVNGVDAVASPRCVRKTNSIGYCPQDSSALEPRLSVREHLVFAARLKSLASDVQSLAALANQALDTLELTASADRLVGALSTSEQRRLCIALALLGLPPVVVLDEPTAGLDAAASARVWTLLTRVREEHQCALIVATQRLDECAAVGTRVGLLYEGALLYFGTYASLRSQLEFGWLLDVRLHEASDANDRASDVGAPVTPATLVRVCEALGHAEWAERVSSAHPTGCWIESLLAHDGLVSPQTFAAWWRAEQAFETLEATLKRKFGRKHVYVLRRDAATCRFQLALADSDVKLSQVFKVLERAQADGVIASFVAAPSTFRDVLATFAESAAMRRQLRDADQR